MNEQAKLALESKMTHHAPIKTKLEHAQTAPLTALENRNLDMNSLNDKDLGDVVRCWFLPAAKVADLLRDLGGKDQHKNLR